MCVLHLLLGLLDDLLDPGGVDAAVLDQLLQRDLGDLAADAVEAGDDHHAGRVVDDHVDAGGLLEGADVPPLAADDPPLHLVAGDVDRADGDLGGVRRGVALDGRRQDLARLLLAGLADGRLVPQNQHADLAPELFLDSLQEHRASLLGRQPADLLQQLALLGLRLLDLLLALLKLLLLLGQGALDRLDSAFLPVDQVELLVQQVGSLLEPLLLLAQILARLVHLAIELVAVLEQLFLGLELRLHADRLGLAVGIGEDLVGKSPGRLSAEPAQDVRAGEPAQHAGDQPDQPPDHRSVHVAPRPFRVRLSTDLAGCRDAVPNAGGTGEGLASNGRSARTKRPRETARRGHLIASRR